ncbi:MAG: polysaccharide biosynthesis C-terminal domain-containing protein, partial [Clostridia bacterium]|nr:polysaccharide biosynthesis C-terminal domain-containing protein [Clostridia bacterium]
VFARPLLLLMDTPEEILYDATVYLITMLLGTLIVTAYNLAASILRALGDSKTPLVAMIIAAVLNIALDLLLVVVFHWGVFGAAFASVISQLISFVFCFLKIRKIEIVRLDKEAFRWDGALAWETLSIGLPLAIQYMIINFGGMILQATVNGLGSGFVAGYTASKKLYGLLECTAVSLGAAFTTYTAQNFGARQYRRIRHGVGVGMVLSVVAAGIFIVLLLPFLRQLPLLFIDAAESEAIDVGVHFLLRMILAMPILYLVYVHRSALQAIGVASWSLISGIFETVVRVSVATVGFSLWGERVLYYSEPLSWLAAWVFVLIPYYFYQRTRVPKKEGNEILQKNLAESAEK